MPQPHCKCIVRSPYGGRKVTYGFNPVFASLENRTAALRWLYDTLMADVRRTCGSCHNREGVVRLPPGLLAVTLRFLISWIVQSPCGCHNICDHYNRRPQDLTIFNNHIYQLLTAEPYRGSMICDRGISECNATPLINAPQLVWTYQC